MATSGCSGCRPAAAALALGIIRLGQTLGLITVPEGIETAEQRDVLRSADCALGQGYHFAKPLASSEVEVLLDLAG